LIYPVFHYRLARLCEERGRVAEAVREYERFPDICREADERLTELADARSRLARLVEPYGP
jgi:hypothetical protein